nr:hypothetical protein [Microbacterium agarici]
MDFIHDVGDGFHGIGHVAFSELFLGRDETDALREQLALDDGCIGEVAEHAGAHVDDDVLHLWVLVDEAKHLLELGAFGNRLGRLAWLDELSAGGDAHLAHLAHRLDSLRGDAIAVLVDVGGCVQLARC